MARQTFQRKEVDSAFRKFTDRANDLLQTDVGVWGDCLIRLIEHCENNSVMQVVLAPLKANCPVDIEYWINNVGDENNPACQYELPTDDEEMAALIYHFLLFVNSRGDQHELVFGFAYQAYGADSDSVAFERVNSQLVEKFVREVGYKIQDLQEEIGNATELTAKELMVFVNISNHDNSTTVYGDISGANIVVGQGTISDSTGTYQTNQDLAEALKALKPLIHQVQVDQRESVQDALETLVDLVEGKLGDVEKAVSAAEELRSKSPTIWQRAKKVLGKASGDLAKEGCILLAKSAFGFATAAAS